MMSHENGLDLGRGTSGLGLRKILVGLGVVFVIALAVVVGKQMSAEAMAVVVGVVCGVAAGIPTSVLLLVVFSRRDRQTFYESDRPQRQHHPPMVVIQGGAPQALPPGHQVGYWPAPPPTTSAGRQFNVVGGDELFLDDG